MQWQPREGTGRRIAHEEILDEDFIGPDAEAASGQRVSLMHNLHRIRHFYRWRTCFELCQHPVAK